MPNLDCTVTTCTYNVDEYCAKGAILVAGEDAKQPRETCCSSFEDKKTCGCTNSSRMVDHQVKVECEAVDCIFNEAKMCNAGQIGIAGSNACTCKETECSSFRPRQ